VTNPRNQLKGVWTDSTPVPDNIVTLVWRRILPTIHWRWSDARLCAFQYDPLATYIILTRPRQLNGSRSTMPEYTDRAA